MTIQLIGIVAIVVSIATAVELSNTVLTAPRTIELDVADTTTLTLSNVTIVSPGDLRVTTTPAASSRPFTVVISNCVVRGLNARILVDGVNSPRIQINDVNIEDGGKLELVGGEMTSDDPIMIANLLVQRGGVLVIAGKPRISSSAGVSSLTVRNSMFTDGAMLKITDNVFVAPGMRHIGVWATNVQRNSTILVAGNTFSGTTRNRVEFGSVHTVDSADRFLIISSGSMALMHNNSFGDPLGRVEFFLRDRSTAVVIAQQRGDIGASGGTNSIKQPTIEALDGDGTPSVGLFVESGSRTSTIVTLQKVRLDLDRALCDDTGRLVVQNPTGSHHVGLMSTLSTLCGAARRAASQLPQSAALSPALLLDSADTLKLVDVAVSSDSIVIVSSVSYGDIGSVNLTRSLWRLTGSFAGFIASSLRLSNSTFVIADAVGTRAGAAHIVDIAITEAHNFSTVLIERCAFSGQVEKYAGVVLRGPSTLHNTAIIVREASFGGDVGLFLPSTAARAQLRVLNNSLILVDSCQFDNRIAVTMSFTSSDNRQFVSWLESNSVCHLRRNRFARGTVIINAREDATVILESSVALGLVVRHEFVGSYPAVAGGAARPGVDKPVFALRGVVDLARTTFACSNFNILGVHGSAHVATSAAVFNGVEITNVSRTSDGVVRGAMSPTFGAATLAGGVNLTLIDNNGEMMISGVALVGGSALTIRDTVRVSTGVPAASVMVLNAVVSNRSAIIVEEVALKGVVVSGSTFAEGSVFSVSQSYIATGSANANSIRFSSSTFVDSIICMTGNTFAGDYAAVLFFESTTSVLRGGFAFVGNTVLNNMGVNMMHPLTSGPSRYSWVSNGTVVVLNNTFTATFTERLNIFCARLGSRVFVGGNVIPQPQFIPLVIQGDKTAAPTTVVLPPASQALVDASQELISHELKLIDVTLSERRSAIDRVRDVQLTNVVLVDGATLVISGAATVGISQMTVSSGATLVIRNTRSAITIELSSLMPNSTVVIETGSGVVILRQLQLRRGASLYIINNPRLITVWFDTITIESAVIVIRNTTFFPIAASTHSAALRLQNLVFASSLGTGGGGGGFSRVEIVGNTVNSSNGGTADIILIPSITNTASILWSNVSFYIIGNRFATQQGISSSNSIGFNTHTQFFSSNALVHIEDNEWRGAIDIRQGVGNASVYIGPNNRFATHGATSTGPSFTILGNAQRHGTFRSAPGAFSTNRDGRAWLSIGISNVKYLDPCFIGNASSLSLSGIVEGPTLLFIENITSTLTLQSSLVALRGAVVHVEGPSTINVAASLELQDGATLRFHALTADSVIHGSSATDPGTAGLISDGAHIIVHNCTFGVVNRAQSFVFLPQTSSPSAPAAAGTLLGNQNCLDPLGVNESVS